MRVLDEIYRRDWGQMLATLIRQVRDIDLAEDALMDAFADAADQFPRDGVPDNPAAWITTAARRRAVDRLRKRGTHEKKREAIEQHLLETADDDAVPEDVLRLLFTCCHPALGSDAQVALALRTLCGLTSEEIARAFIVPHETLQQRLVRAKNKIKAAGIPYEVPADDVLDERVEAVMKTIYLVFNEGYTASFGDDLMRADLAAEAIRLGRMLVERLPARSEPKGLLALMLLHDARRETRVDEHGAIVLLEEQDRSRWNRTQIDEGARLVEEALRSDPPRLPSAYALQAAIAALHAQAPTAADTDWAQIAALYAILARVAGSPVVELNHAAAVAMADGPERGLRLIDAIAGRGALAGYYLLPAARADLLRRLGRLGDAAAEYEKALALVTNQAERRYLERRLLEVTAT
jgi:RNA polymerase sigma-70 factor, ECF subfamily